MKVTPFIALLLYASVCAEEPKAWLDDYFATINALDAERDAFIVARDDSLKEALASDRLYRVEEEAMYRYLFVYHIEHKTGLLDWNDGDWRLSIMVCNCGEEGSVPTDEFKRLFEERSKALVSTDKVIDREVALRIARVRREMPSEWHDRKWKSLDALKARFDALVPIEERRPRQWPPQFVPPSEVRDEGEKKEAQPGATDNLGYAQRIREGFSFRSS